MPLNPDEIVALTGTDFVTEVPNIRYRQHGNVLGIIKMYQDRFEWHDPGLPEPVVVIPYETVSGWFLLFLYITSVDIFYIWFLSFFIYEYHYFFDLQIINFIHKVFLDIIFLFSELRVSSPDKPKVQIQAVLTDQEHVNFHFVESGRSKDQLLELQKKTRAELQNLIVRHRKILKTVSFFLFTKTFHYME